MRYVMLIYQPDAVFDARTDAKEKEFWGAWKRYYDEMVEAGVYVAGDRLERASTAATVRVRDGKRRVQAGPFAETKEQLGGFIVLELPSLDEALDWAARCPTAARGIVEVRPVGKAPTMA
jgi:hypothetical protein